MIGAVFEGGRCCGMEMNVERAKVMRISRQPSPVHIMIDQKQPENVECVKYLGSMKTNDASCTREIQSRFAMAKTAFNKKKILFTSKLNVNLRKKVVKCYIRSMVFMVMKFGHIRNSLKVLKFVAREG
jgi:hypothetical protein